MQCSMAGTRAACNLTRTRPAPLPLRTRAGRAPLRVLAFRDQARQRQIKETAREFAMWFSRAIVEGPSSGTTFPASIDSDPYLEFTVAHPLQYHTFKGLESVKAKLSDDHTTRYGTWTSEGKPIGKPQVLAVAASETSDVAFCLISLPPALSTYSASSVGDLEAGAQGGALPSTMLLKLDLMIDDSARRVVRVEERSQLVSELDEARQGLMEMMRSAGQQVPEAALLGAPLPHAFTEQQWGATETPAGPPPEVHAAAEEGSQVRAAGALRSFCELPNSARPIGPADLEKLIDIESYRMYDAYGISLLLLGIPPQGSLDAEQTLGMILALQSIYDVSCKIQDVAICDDAALGFTHWTSHLYNKTTGREWAIQSMDVHMLDGKTGKIKGSYTFRDALDFEDWLLISASSMGHVPPPVAE